MKMKKIKVLREDLLAQIYQLNKIMARADENGKFTDEDEKQWNELFKHHEKTLAKYNEKKNK